MTGSDHEDLEDLRSLVARLSAEQAHLREQLEAVHHYLGQAVTDQADQITKPVEPPVEASAPQQGTTRQGMDERGGDQHGQGEKKTALLRFVLTFPYKTPEEKQRRLEEIENLADWVERVIVSVYGGEVRAGAPWCAQWYMHAEAVARLHAAWMAWQGLVADPKAGGATGPSAWHRLHLDPMLAQLRSPQGPFAACMTNPDSDNHRLLPRPTTVTPPGLAARRARQSRAGHHDNPPAAGPA